MPKIIKQTGSNVEVWGYFFRPTTKAPRDPDTLQFRVLSPNGAVVIKNYGVDVEVVRDDVGAYWFLLALPQEGTYHWRWVAAAAPNDAVVVVGDLDSVSYPDF